MRLPLIVVAFFVICGIVDRWPIRWLAWLWLMLMSLPFVAIAVPILLVELAIVRLFGIAKRKAISAK
jgi:hypothetical protein